MSLSTNCLHVSVLSQVLCRKDRTESKSDYSVLSLDGKGSISRSDLKKILPSLLSQCNLLLVALPGQFLKRRPPGYFGIFAH